MERTHRRETTGSMPGNPNGGIVDREALAEGVIIVLGVSLVALAVLSWRVTELTPFDAAITASPGVATASAWYFFRRSSDVATYAVTVARWVLGSAVVLGGFILAVLVVQSGSLVEAAPLVVFLTGTGSTAGVFMGVNRVRSRQAQRRAEALETERERLDFLNQLLRHNVLNKVNVIQGNATFAAEASEETAEYYEVIQAQSNDVVDLVENVRVLVNAAIGDGELRPVDLSASLQREVTAARQAHERARIEADVPDGVTVRANDLLRYVFENLLTNAIEHNDADPPEVVVTVSEGSETVAVEIADNGPGLPADRRESIFAPEQGDHGIGLYLVHTLVSQYGGEVSVSDNEPRGTVFTVRLPAAEPGRNRRIGSVTNP